MRILELYFISLGNEITMPYEENCLSEKNIRDGEKNMTTAFNF